MSRRFTHFGIGQYMYIPDGLRVGKQMIIHGKIPFGSEGFSFNLDCGDYEGCDNAFHFNPRLGEQCVVRNSFIGGDWGGEEREANYFPFSEGGDFHLRFAVRESEYKIFVNGHTFGEFNHRLAPETVKYIRLSEGAEYYDVSFQDSPRVPYRSELPARMAPGKAFRIRGTVRDDDNGFSFNVKDPEDNNLFHFNPRVDERVVVRNANYGGEWGEEEREGDDFPFDHGELVDSTIVGTDDGYMVYVNEKLFTQFNHRGPSEEAACLSIKGGINLADVSILDPIDDDVIKEIPSGLTKGDIIQVKGYFRSGGERFFINLCNGLDRDANIALHFNPRRGDDQIIFNNNVGGDWQEEERVDLPDIFRHNVPFEVKIITKSRKFKCYVNDVKIHSFEARGSVEEIKGIHVGGDAYFHDVKLLRKAEKPFVERLPGSLQDGGWIFVRGVPKKDRGGFAINLQCGRHDDADIAFHFNPRLNEGETVRNSRMGDWGDEERDQPDFPFEKKDNFEVAIKVESWGFKTYVNGQKYVDYNHRLPFEDVSHIRLAGEAEFYEPEYC